MSMFGDSNGSDELDVLEALDSDDGTQPKPRKKGMLYAVYAHDITKHERGGIKDLHSEHHGLFQATSVAIAQVNKENIYSVQVVHIPSGDIMMERYPE